MDLSLYKHTQEVVKLLIAAIPGCRPMGIGGSIRDMLWRDKNHLPEVKDQDLEVFGATHEQIVEALKGHYELDFVGRKFGVLKVKGYPIDISLPRLEECTGDGHKDFDIKIDPNLTPEQAALRRDFTINSVAFDWKLFLDNPAHGDYLCYVDPYNGVNHIRAQLLHPISSKFEEDPVRPLRAMQFIARFDLICSHELIVRCTAMKDKVAALPKERVQEEWNKLLLKGKHIGKGLQFLVDTGLIDLYPELKALRGVPQSPKYHPEGDCWIHTCLCLDAFAANRTGNEAEDLLVGYAVIGHDLGKATTTKINPATGDWCAHGHENESVPLIRQFMERMFAPEQDIIKLVEKLVLTHMRPANILRDGGGLSAFRRMSLAVDGRIDLLKQVVQADRLGCGSAKFSNDLFDWMDQSIQTCNLKPNEGPQPIIKGQHLIDVFQMKPGREFGPILKQAFEAQLDGKFVDEASGIEFVRSILPKVP